MNDFLDRRKALSLGIAAGAHWLVMELVEGENLAQIIRDQGRIAGGMASNCQGAMAIKPSSPSCCCGL